MVRPKNSSAPKRQRTRSNDREVKQMQRNEQAKSASLTADEAWAKIRANFDDETVGVVDALIEKGFGLPDLLRLELYEHQRIDKAIRHFLKQPQSSTLVHSLASVKLQCRKHLRSIMLAMGPALRVGDMPVVLAAGMTERELLSDADGDDNIIN